MYVTSKMGAPLSAFVHWICVISRVHKSKIGTGRTTLNHSMNGVVVDSPGKKQTRVWDILKACGNWFPMSLVFYNKNATKFKFV